MLKRSSIASIALGLAFLGGAVLDIGCKKPEETKTPDEEQLAAKEPSGSSGASEDNEEANVGYSASEGEEGGADTPSEDMDAAAAKGDDKLKRPEPKEVCKGKGKKRECKMVDPDPGTSAQIGVNALIKGYTWGMSPDAVLAELGKSVEAEYDKKQKAAKDATTQDRNREWRKEQLDELRRGHVKFTSGSKHKWGVSLIQFDFADDSNEEMVWTRSGRYLRKFFFFKDGGLWKIVYAYQKEKWGDKEYEAVVDESFKKWFGMMPEAKVKQDPKTAAPLLRYNEWTSKNNEKVRSFNLSAVHGVYMLSVVDGNIESSIGERLPNIKEDEDFSSDVGDVLGGSDVEYDADGKIITK
ncbi:MAG: hypothetical protein H6710_10960 [Myxococcales bacterium]|nr:hypothetical protein [Myxococcales bacterium]MCB9702472.1 hypothetical protein [Myxococcales bacterium]